MGTAAANAETQHIGRVGHVRTLHATRIHLDQLHILNEPVEVNTAKGKLLGIGTGSIHLTVEGQDGTLIQITLYEVLYVSGMDSNLLSSNVLLGKGVKISAHPIKGTNLLLSGVIVAKTVPHGKLWRLKTVSDENEEHALKTVGREPVEPFQPRFHTTLAIVFSTIWSHGTS